MMGRSILLGLCLLVAGPVAAGNVYRCTGGDGTTTYASKRIKGASCRIVAGYRASRVPIAPLPAAGPVPNPAATPAPGASAPATLVAAPVSVARQPAAGVGGPRLVRGQVYAYVGKDGVRNYTSVRPAGVSSASIRTIKYSYMQACYACSLRPGVDFGKLRLNTVAYESEIRAAAREHGVEEAIVRAIIHAESAFNPNALSRVGAQGLMQLMPATARRFGVGDAFDAKQNIRGGVQYLAFLLKRFNGNLTLAAAGYNAGEGAVAKYGGVPPYSETQRYVQRVGLLADRYRGVINPVAAPLPGGLSAR